MSQSSKGQCSRWEGPVVNRKSFFIRRILGLLKRAILYNTKLANEAVFNNGYPIQVAHPSGV